MATAKPASSAKPRTAKPARKRTVTRKAAPAPSARTASKALGIFSLGAAAVAIGAAIYGVARQILTPSEGHAAPDLALDQPRPSENNRAPAAFRPDPTAPVSAAERESLRPATGPVPTLVRDEGVLPDTVH
jgi:hypothetical protein